MLWGGIAFGLLMTLSFVALFALRCEPEQAENIARMGVSGVYGLVSMVPLLAVTVRRLHDAGYSAKSFLWLLIPVIGPIAFFARLCSKTKK